VVLISYFSIFGVWQKLPFLLPPFMLLRDFNLASSSLEGLAIFLSVVIALLVGLIMTRNRRQKTRDKKDLLFLYLLLIPASLLLMIIDFHPAWIVILVTSVSLLIFALLTRIFKKEANLLFLPILLIFTAVLFLSFINIRDAQWAPMLLSEQTLDQGTSWKIAFETIKENSKNLFLGSGPATWQYDFSKQKPVSFNQTPLWRIRFDRASNYISEILATTGLLGAISFLLLIGMSFLVYFLLKNNLDCLPYILALLALFVAQFVYYQNTLLAFTFWFILGMVVISCPKSISEKTFSFKDFSELSLIFSTFLVIFCLLIFSFYYFGAKFYLADVNYAKSQRSSSIEERLEFLGKAIDLNPELTTYRVVLARTLLFQLLEEASRPLAEQDLVKIQNLASRAINRAQEATEIAPNNVTTWEALGVVYRDIQDLAEGTTNWAIGSFQKAIELESENPVLYTEVGKLYLRLEDFQKAKNYFVRAKESKPDYVDALIQEALIIYEIENDPETAVKKMEDLIRDYPFNIEVRFQLGLLYFNQDRLDEAIFQFEGLIRQVPNHSNALYSLAVVYAKKGETEKAILLFERVLELNPGNETVIEALEQLKSGI
jgi:tetratricopeptide (TPR) repeat protein